MASAVSMTEQEELTAVVFGDTFALYDERAFDEFIAPLYARLEANGIPRTVFQGKRCLDAGCGGGRGSVLMAQCGAKEVIGVDMAPKNVETCRKWAAAKGFANLSFHQGSLAQLPFPDAQFDVVWCNGVLHHTTDPDKGLQEVTRVLKTGGDFWLYLYGSGGLYWYVVDWIRDLLSHVDVRRCILSLRLMDMPVRRIAEWIDDWFCAYLRRYTHADVAKRLEELGYQNTDLLRRGVHYDTSQRRFSGPPREAAFMGEGDLRYFAKKARPPSGNRFPLPDPPDRKGSPYVDDPLVTQFEAPLRAIKELSAHWKGKVGGSLEMERVVVARAVHSAVRTLLEQDGPFDESHLRRQLEALRQNIQLLVSA